jgi:hypothetical protein
MVVFQNKLQNNEGNLIAVFSSHYTAFCALNMIQNPDWKPLNPSMFLSTDLAMIKHLHLTLTLN